jgi:hypothetical protein
MSGRSLLPSASICYAIARKVASRKVFGGGNLSRVGVQKDIESLVARLDRSFFVPINDGFGFSRKPFFQRERSKDPMQEGGQQPDARVLSLPANAKKPRTTSRQGNVFLETSALPIANSRTEARKDRRTGKLLGALASILFGQLIDSLLVAFLLLQAFAVSFLAINPSLSYLKSLHRAVLFLTREFDVTLTLAILSGLLICYYIVFWIFRTKSPGTWIYSKIIW